MIKSLYLTGRSLNARIRNIELVANNLANINSVGFKRQVPFTEVLNQEGNVLIQQMTDHREGDKVATTNQLDLSIDGKGYFLLKNDSGELEISQDGKFKVSQDGFIVNQNGYKLMSNSGEINLNGYMLDDKQNIGVSRDGVIKIGDTPIAELSIVQPNDLNGLMRTSASNFLVENGDYTPADSSKFEISQGYLEESNVNPIIEMENMIQINTDYESAQRMIQYLDQSLEKAIEAGRV